VCIPEGKLNYPQKWQKVWLNFHWSLWTVIGDFSEVWKVQPNYATQWLAFFSCVYIL